MTKVEALTNALGYVKEAGAEATYMVLAEMLEKEKVSQEKKDSKAIASNAAKAEILAELAKYEEPVNRNVIAEALDRKPGSVTYYLTALVKEGKVVVEKSGKKNVYSLAVADDDLMDDDDEEIDDAE